MKVSNKSIMFQPFPREEYEKRWTKAKKDMKEANMDALILTTRKNIFYFSGLLSYGWSGPPLFILHSRKEPTFVMSLSEIGNATMTTWVKDMRTWGSYVPEERGKKDYTEYVTNVLKDLKLEGCRIGIELDDQNGLPRYYEIIKQKLPGSNFVNAKDIVQRIRLVKSPLEIKCIRRACEITCKGYKAGLEALQEGMTEDEVARIIWIRMLKEGCDLPALSGYIILRGGKERNKCFGAVPLRKKLSQRDIIKIDGGSRFNGYWCDMSRYACVGKLTNEQKRMYEADVEANEACIAVIKPGAKFTDVFQAGLEVIEKAGYKELAFSRADTIFGHSTGINVEEPPMVDEATNITLKPRMVLCVEPQINAYPPDFYIGVFSVEDVVLVTEEGNEVLTKLDKEMWIV